MIGRVERRRVLFAASDVTRASLSAAFGNSSLNSWDLSFAASFWQCRFVMQVDPCDVLLVHEEMLEREDGQGAFWLTHHRNIPMVFLAPGGSPNAARALELGADAYLAWEDALAQPNLLAAVMNRALELQELRGGLAMARQRLAESRRHVDRLVSAMWRLTPAQEDCPWFSQRYMLERLTEETARAERHKLPLTVALGELNAAGDHILPDWTVETIVREKRKCDVAGQYGMNGFLLLLVQTTKPGAVQCVQRLQRVIEHAPEHLPGPTRTYFGLSSFSKERNSPAAILRAAEEALESARTLQASSIGEN